MCRAYKSKKNMGPEINIPFPRARFVVLSDVHYYDVSLGKSGPAFEKMLKSHRDIKLIRDSGDILQSAMNSINALSVDFVLICGDLTKDGELASHLQLARELKKLVAGGKKIYVINGNHDIQNSRARRFKGALVLKTATVTREEFSQIYGDFGFQDAVARDTHSLSYVSEPVPGLWLLAIDTCRQGNRFYEDGRLGTKTLRWIKQMLMEARRRNKAVLGMMHHGLLEHYRGNSRYFSAYLIKNHRQVSRVLCQYGLKFVFSGHFHAQDVAVFKWPELPDHHFIYDIETGSLLTYPCPYRVVDINADTQKMHVQSNYITATASHPRDFQDYAYRYAYALTEELVAKTFKRWGLPDKDIVLLAPQMIYAFETHCTGNKRPGAKPKFSGLSIWGKVVLSYIKGLIEGLTDHSPPPDNNIIIDMMSGEYHYILSRKE